MKILCCCTDPCEYVILRNYCESLGHEFQLVSNFRNILGKPEDYDVVLSTEYFAGSSIHELMERGYGRGQIINLTTCKGNLREIITNFLNKGETHEIKEERPKQKLNSKTKKNLIIKKKYFKGISLPYRNLYQKIDRFSKLPLSILIFGKTGTGKEHIAHEIHTKSNVSGNFVSVDCGAITDELINSELFGHVKGSFTGAFQDKVGYFESSNEGTIFFDEIENLSPKGQLALLRVLQEKTFKKVGSTREQVFNSRLICATNVDLEKQVEKGLFRLDLFYRINQICLVVPSLEDVLDDVPDLIDFLVREINQEYSQQFFPTNEFKNKVLEKLYPFKGNIRQLKSYLIEEILGTHENLTNLQGIELLQVTGY